MGSRPGIRNSEQHFIAGLSDYPVSARANVVAVVVHCGDAHVLQQVSCPLFLAIHPGDTFFDSALRAFAKMSSPTKVLVSDCFKMAPHEDHHQIGSRALCKSSFPPVAKVARDFVLWSLEGDNKEQNLEENDEESDEVNEDKQENYDDAGMARTTSPLLRRARD
eukprot:NODE_14867_length_1080_cov_5.565582.p1 GENE.NODE_14867_length_1080_cov_5.565582~~NODE_14867_length_1080_cov_5.565582.p1  ORF type:complete len:188 (+),score=32.17 NODE_14867_length_1080_cov_5.565582:73-564(+)